MPQISHNQQLSFRLLENANIEISAVKLQKVILVLGTGSPALSDNMIEVSYMSVDSVSKYDPMDVDYERKLIMWKEMGFILVEVTDQKNSEACLPAAMSECLTIALRWSYQSMEIPCVSTQYLMDYIPRPLAGDGEKCMFEDAYDFLKAHGAVFHENYVPFTGNRNIPPHPGPVVRTDDARIVRHPTQTQLTEVLEYLDHLPLLGGIHDLWLCSLGEKWYISYLRRLYPR